MTKQVSFCIFYLTFLCFFSSQGQKFERLNDAFPIPPAEEIFQDKYGFLWIGTTEGLIKYDGYRFTLYTNQPEDSGSLPGGTVQTIYEDEQKRMWIGVSNRGLYSFNRADQTFHHQPLAHSENEDQSLSVLDIQQDPQGILYVGTNQGLFTLKERRDSFSIQNYVPVPDDTRSVSSRYILRIYITKNERVLLGTANGVNIFNPSTHTFSNWKNTEGIPKGQVSDIQLGPKHKIWIASKYSPYMLYTWDFAERNFYPFTDFDRDLSRSLRITFSNDGNELWIGAQGKGFYSYLFNQEHLTFFNPVQNKIHGYADYFPKDLYTDTYGNIWSAGGNIHKMPMSRKKFHSIPGDGFLTISVAATRNYIWYCGTKPYRWNKHTGETETYWPDQIPHDLRFPGKDSTRIIRINTMLPVNQHELWIATTRNLISWKEKDDSWLEYAFDLGGPIRDMVIGKSGHIWVSPNQGSLLEFDPKTGSHTRHENTPLSVIRNAMVIDADSSGNIWVGTAGYGAFCFNEATLDVQHFHVHSNEQSRKLTSDDVLDIETGADHTVWIGTKKGLNKIRLKEGLVRNYRSTDGLVNEHISSILEDKNGKIWMGTNMGITKLDPVLGIENHYNQSDGLINSLYALRAAYMDPEGILYFSGDHGIDYFNPDEIGINEVPPDLYISNLVVNDTPYLNSEQMLDLEYITLPYNQNFLEIELLGLHLTAPKNNQYAYFIENLNKRWVEMGNKRFISLPDLDPGVYTLFAKAANADLVWSDEKKLLEFRIRPPFWQTWWFYALISLFTFGLFWSINWYRINQIKKQEAIKAEFNKKLAEIELKALHAQMNPHFLFNSLNSVKSLIGQNQTQKAALYLTRFSQLLRSVLNNSREKMVRLQDDIAALRLYLELERMRFEDKFDFRIQIGENVNEDFVEVPPLLMQPFVENAIWHGLMHKLDGKGMIDIEIDRYADRIRIRIKDNGIGRKKAAELHTRSSSKAESLGMKITEDRLSLLREIYGSDATLQINDLFDQQGLPSGTLVSITIPVRD